MGDSTVAVRTSSKRSHQSDMEDDDLISLQTKLFNDPKYSDLTIKCGDKTWNCHRAILCKRCPFFEAACGGSFIEAETRYINLSEDDPADLRAMLFFLYTAEFPEPENEKAMSLSFAHQVAMIADKYGVVALRDQAVTKMTTICKLNLVRWLKTDKYVAKGIDKVRQIWQVELDCFDSVKDVIVEELASGAAYVLDREDFQQLLADEKDLNMSLIKLLSKRARLATRP